MKINGHSTNMAGGAEMDLKLKGERPDVEVSFKRDEFKQLHVSVSVRSRLKKSSLMIGDLSLKDFTSMEQLRKKICVLAGALAEDIASRLGDPFVDPDRCANDAGKAWDELLKKSKGEIPA